MFDISNDFIAVIGTVFACVPNNNTVFMDMDGPSIGGCALVRDLWLPSAPPAGTTFRFQAWLDNAMKDYTDNPEYPVAFLSRRRYNKWVYHQPRFRTAHEGRSSGWG